MTPQEAHKLLATNPAALTIALRDVRDCYSAARHAHTAPATLDAEHSDFWKSLTDKSPEEQFRLANNHLAMLGKVLTEHESEKQRAFAYLESVRANTVAQESARRDRELFVARNTRGVAGILQTFQMRIAGINAQLGGVTCPADLSQWWSNFDDLLEATKKSIAAELATRSVSAEKRAAA